MEKLHIQYIIILKQVCNTSIRKLHIQYIIILKQVCNASI